MERETFDLPLSEIMEEIIDSLIQILLHCCSLSLIHVVFDSLVEPNNFHHKAPQARSGPDPSHKAKPSVST